MYAERRGLSLGDEQPRIARMDADRSVNVKAPRSESLE